MILLAQEQLRDKPQEFLTDPLLTVAAFMLVAVCVLSILFSRLISYNLRRKAWKIRRIEGQLKAGMTPDEIRAANARRRHHLRHRKPTHEPSHETEDADEVEAEPASDYSI